MTRPRERAVAFVVARLSSSRLPNKQLQRIGGRSILEWIMDSLARCTELDDVVLATVAEADNEPLRVIAEERGWRLFWYEGEVDDVVGRLTTAADAFDADICLLISADCPLVHAPSVDELVAALRRDAAADCLVVPARESGDVCLLEGVQVARRRAWQATDELSDRPELREHQFPVLYRSPDRFVHRPVTLGQAVYGAPHRLSIDTPADLEFMRRVHVELEARDRSFALPDTVALLHEQPALRQINAHVHQRALVEHPRRVLFVVDAGGEFGFGHLMRCREIAAQLIERLGWPVTFAVDDRQVLAMLREEGSRVTWGAFGRPVRDVPPDGVSALEPAGSGLADLVVIDVSAARSIAMPRDELLGWGAKVVFLDREDGVAAQADMIVYPGVSGRRKADDSASAQVLHGIEYAVVRREVARRRDAGVHKDIDLLTYLYDGQQRLVVEQLARQRGWVAVGAGEFGEFIDLLSRARVFVSGYGQAFYEAVVLGTVPVAWPLSANHALDAGMFFDALQLPRMLVSTVDEAETLLTSLLDHDGITLPPVEDGTPRIVSRLQHLFPQ
ncbi:MAG: NTP transferase domain-containing protein [Gammaproteobacteria bacterium]|nr:NTP transferase domain-containing protein [Gammaproteobacteria bacterium]